jgi:hypothetical protein
MPRPVEASINDGRTLFACDTCDKDDPMSAANPWIKGELKPPT